MTCVGHRLQCELANLTNHKFPATVQWVFEVKCNQLYVTVGMYVQRSGSKVTVLPHQQWFINFQNQIKVFQKKLLMWQHSDF